jgi:hypothetical protein
MIIKNRNYSTFVIINKHILYNNNLYNNILEKFNFNSEILKKLETQSSFKGALQL